MTGLDTAMPEESSRQTCTSFSRLDKIKIENCSLQAKVYLFH